MLKLLLGSAIVSPCIFLQVAGSVKAEAVSYNAPSFEAYFIDPEFERLESCDAAELDVFFHKQYVTMHSAEYIAEAIALLEKCDEVEYVIQPIQPIYSPDDDLGSKEITDIQVNELSLMLKAHGVDAEIAETKVQSEFDSLSENGRTAVLKITTRNGKSGKAA
jgi:hypothetical protein